MYSPEEREPLLQSQRQGYKSKSQDFKLEPALVVVFFGWYLSSPLIPNQMLIQTCLTQGFTPSDCHELGSSHDTREIEEKIQPEVAKILMVTSLLNAIVPASLSLFLGPWTDKFGRKKVICATFVGYSLALASLATISIISDGSSSTSPWFYILPYFPIILTGGWPTLLVSTLCYITDLSSETNRSLRFAIIEAIIYFGIVLGIASSSHVLKATSATTVFGISTISVTAAVIYTIIYVEESLNVDENAVRSNQLAELFSLTPVIEIFKTCFKPRLHNVRRMLWYLIVVFALSLLTTYGTYNLFYLFVREKFHWTLKEATHFDSITNIVSIVGCVSGLAIMTNFFKLSDISIAFIVISSGLLDSLIKAAAQSTNTLYLAPAAGLLKNLSLPICRSLIASIIPKNEIGKVYSFASSFEVVPSLIAAPLYTFVYTNTFKYFTGAFYLITAGICIINLVLVFNIMKIIKTYRRM